MAIAFREHRKRKAGRFDKILASVASAVQASIVLTLVGFINLGSAGRIEREDTEGNTKEILGCA